MEDKKVLINVDDARRGILAIEPMLAYIVDQIKPVDAVEVVRCEDCKNTCPGWNGIVCTIWGAGTEPNNFCSYGERKDNEICND